MALAALLEVALFSTAPPAASGEAAPTPFLQWTYLTGDWGGRRTRIEKTGLTITPVYTGMALSNRAGGIAKRTLYLGNLDLIVSINAERLWGSRGTSFFVYLLGDHGDKPGETVGDAQGVSNIEARSTLKIFEAWGQQTLAGDRVSLLAGLYDLNSEFDTLGSASFLTHSSFGIGPEYGKSGRNGPSIFPTSSLGVRGIVRPIPSFRVMTAVLDGVPGDPDDPDGTHIALGHGDGALVATELTYFPDLAPVPNRMLGPRRSRIGRGGSPLARNKFSLGGWYYASEFNDLSSVDAAGQPVRRNGSSGFYGSVQHLFHHDPVDPGRYIAIFARAGSADPRVNRFDRSLTGGAVWRGPSRRRAEDQIGLAFATAWNGGHYRQAQEIAGRPVDRAETAIELSYSAAISPWMVLQPELQYVRHPGTVPVRGDAFILGLVVQMAF